MTLRALRGWVSRLRNHDVVDVATAIRRGRVVRRHYADHVVRWLITNPGDEIQNAQAKRGYYEHEDLERLRELVGPRKIILDIGANIGNHSVFFANRFGADRVVLVEPYLPAVQHLLANLSLNFSPAFDLAYLGLAVGRREDRGAVIEPSKFNMGLTQIVSRTEGAVRIVKGDQVSAGRAVDLIKIDVEGMELDVMSGLSETLTVQRPALFVEVGDANLEKFMAVIQSYRYKVAHRRTAYATQSNIICVPG